MDVKQHGSAGVGHISAVDAAGLPPGQTLSTSQSNNCDSSIVETLSMTSTQPAKEQSYPNEPGVDGAEHGAVRDDSFVDLVHVVHQPAEFHRTEVGADGEPGFML